jgi:DNA-binding response OmpR family regulator
MSIRYLIVGWEAQARTWVLHHLSAAYPYADLRTMTIADFERQRGSINRRNTDIVVLCAAFGAAPDERKSEGISALKKVAQQPAFPAIVVVADGGSEFTAVRSLRLGALDYLPRRHLSGERLLETIEKTIRFVKDRNPRVGESSRVVSSAPTASQVSDVSVAVPVERDYTLISPEPEVSAILAPEATEVPEAPEGPEVPGVSDAAPPAVAAIPVPSSQEALGAIATAELLEGSSGSGVAAAQAPQTPASLVDVVSSDAALTNDEAAAAPMIDIAEIFTDPSPSQLKPKSAVAAFHPEPTISRRTKRSDPWPEVPGYTLLQRIAESDHAFVLLARQGKRRERIALKISKIARGSATGAREVASASLEREFDTLSTLSHRSIVEIYDFGSVDGFDYLAMEYFPCGDLRRRLQNPLSESEIIDYTRQVARALEFVHRVGLVHGDLKPQNVMLRADNSIALIDFGLVSDHKREAGTDQTGLVCGSPYYMSPEQTRSQRLDGRSDLYSLGVMLYEMLTGARPFVAKSIPEIIDMHRNALAAPLPAEYARFQPIVDKLLAKDPDTRFADASQLLVALDSFGGARSAVAAEMR